MKYDITIGLEVHVQLKTKSKMFCACATSFGELPNTNVCPVCLGYPGAMPVMNELAIKYTVIAGLMIGSRINSYSKFDRKSYFYPDMPKNYQISQYDEPLCIGGAVDIEVDGRSRSVGVTRIHLEEDVAKNMHFGSSSGVDFNRAGTPLMEVVSEPDMHSPDEAFAFLHTLKQIMLYAGVSECNLEEGNMRCDVNCSAKPSGEAGLGTKTEIKNMNTFKGVHDALCYEAARHVEVLESGGSIVQETRRWDPDAGVTLSMRTKEDAHDYRYFPEPDLMPVVLADELVASWRDGLPELPKHRRERLVSQYGLPEYDAHVLAADKAVADYFESAAASCPNYKAVSNWIMTEMMRHLSEAECDIGAVKVTPAALADLVGLVDSSTINLTSAKEVFGIMLTDGGAAADIVAEKGLAQVSDSGELEGMVEQVIAGNPKSVEDYRGGKKAALQFLMGQVMRLSQGKANPKMVMDLLKSSLD